MVAQSSAPPFRAPAASSFYSVQVAAYNSEEDAQRIARILVDQGLEARVDGTARPFRVRIGRYPTRAEAVKAQQALKARGHPGFVAVVNP